VSVSDDARTALAKAVRHVSRARRIVAQQRALIARLKADGHLIDSHEYTLDLFERTLRLFEDHERQLRAELERHLGVFRCRGVADEQLSMITIC
jgi:hypothetical protein